MRTISPSSMPMRIVVPTRGRVGNQITLSNLGPTLRRQTTVVCPESEVEAHRKWFPECEYTAQPDSFMSIAQKRSWIIRRSEVDRILMLDDDLFFYHRREDVPDRLLDATERQMHHWFCEISEKLQAYAHAGFGPRQGNHVQPSGWQECGRTMLALGYRTDVLRQFELGRIETREDMDYTLQLLRAGYKNAVNHEFAVGQKSYNAAGGCSDQRTTAASDADAWRLAELHPGFVTVVQRNYKSTPRKEVICRWKKAYASSLNTP